MATRLNITYSAYRELETIPQSPLRDIGEAIIGLADDPHPPGSSLLKGIGGCYYLPELPRQDGRAQGRGIPGPRELRAGGRRPPRDPPPPRRSRRAGDRARRLPRGRRPGRGADRQPRRSGARANFRGGRDRRPLRAVRGAVRLLHRQVPRTTARPAARPRRHGHALPRLLRDLPRAGDDARGVPRRVVQRGARPARGAGDGARPGRPPARPRRAVAHVRLRSRVALPLQHDARLRARRRGAGAGRQRRDAREPVGDRRRDPGLGRKRKTSPGPLGPGNAWIGQNPDTGFRIVAPWIEPDPGIAHPALTLAERRAMLAADGAQLLPGSGAACGGSLEVGACENGYREAVVFADVDLPAGATTASVDPTLAPPPRFSAAVRVR